MFKAAAIAALLALASHAQRVPCRDVAAGSLHAVQPCGAEEAFVGLLGPYVGTFEDWHVHARRGSRQLRPARKQKGYAQVPWFCGGEIHSCGLDHLDEPDKPSRNCPFLRTNSSHFLYKKDPLGANPVLFASGSCGGARPRP